MKKLILLLMLMVAMPSTAVSNANVHIDEFKNGIDIKKIEMLKDYWWWLWAMQDEYGQG